MLSGFEYFQDFLGERECAQLLEAVAAMPLAEAQYKQFTARRRVIHFGGRYDFSNNELLPGGPLPEVLMPLRERIGATAGNASLDAGSLYLLRGPARWEWQHRVPPVPQLRYSITFRTLRR
jgi:hypothetical protein